MLQLPQALHNVSRKLGLGLRVPVVAHPKYRLPVASLLARTGMDPRRPELALWWLQDNGWLAPADVHTPTAIAYSSLALVHTPAWRDALAHADALAQVLAVDPWDIDIDEVTATLRLVVGGTVLAAQLAVQAQIPHRNLPRLPI